MIINESGMQFGDYPDNHVFYIEKSEEYNRIKGYGVKIVEFALLNKSKLLLVEAKSSAPNPESKDTPERFGEYISDIAEKMRNSLDLYLHQLVQKKLSEELTNTDYYNTVIVCVLIIKNQQKEWIPPVQEALSKEILKHIRMNIIWKCKVIVINEEQAVSQKLVLRIPEENL